MDLFEEFEALTTHKAVALERLKPDTARYFMPLIIQREGPYAAYAFYKTLPIPPQANAGMAWIDLWFLRELLNIAPHDLIAGGWKADAETLAGELLGHDFDAGNLLPNAQDARLAQRRRQYIPYPTLLGQALKQGYVSLLDHFRDLCGSDHYAAFVRHERNMLLQKAMECPDNSVWTFVTAELERLWPGEMQCIRSRHVIDENLFVYACSTGHAGAVEDFITNGPWSGDTDTVPDSVTVKGISEALARGNKDIAARLINAAAANPLLLRRVLHAGNATVFNAALAKGAKPDLASFMLMLTIALKDSLSLAQSAFGLEDFHLLHQIGTLGEKDFRTLMDEIKILDPEFLRWLVAADNFALFRYAAGSGKLENIKYTEELIREILPTRHKDLFNRPDLRSGHLSPAVFGAFVVAQSTKHYGVCDYVMKLAGIHNQKAADTLMKVMNFETMTAFSGLGRLLAEQAQAEKSLSSWRRVTNYDAPHSALETLSPMGFKPAVYQACLPFLLYADRRDHGEAASSTAARNAYKLAMLFSNRQEAARYLEPRLSGFGFFTRQPVHDACLFEIPAEGAWTVHHWRGLTMKYGMSAARYLKLAPKIEEAARFAKESLPATSKDVLKFALKVAYARAAEHPQFSELCLTNGVDETAFNLGMDQIQSGLKKRDYLPRIRVSGRAFGAPNLYLNKLKPGDLRGYVLGPMMGCCQILGDAGEAVAVHGMTSRYGGFYVVQKKQGKRPRPDTDPIIGGSWSWLSQEAALVNDSLERRGPVYESAALAMMDHMGKTLVGRPLPRHAKLNETFITSVQLGMGGQTPHNLNYPEALEAATPVDHKGNSDSTRRYLLARALKP